MRSLLAARRSWKIRAVPAITVISPPQMAANRIATPSGRFQCQPRKAKFADVVFWVTKVSSTIRISMPTGRAVHAAAARVNLTDSGVVVGVSPDGGTCADGGVASGGCSGDAESSLLIISIFALSDRERNPIAPRTMRAVPQRGVA